MKYAIGWFFAVSRFSDETRAGPRDDLQIDHSVVNEIDHQWRSTTPIGDI
jgi:hypothetical protein